MKKPNLNQLYFEIKHRRAELAEYAQWLPRYEKLKAETTVYAHWTGQDEADYKKDVALVIATTTRLLEKAIADYKAAGGKRVVD